MSWAGHRQAALLDALHDVYLQGVHIRSLVLALGATEVRRLFGGASPLAGQGQVKGVVSWRKRTGSGYGTNCMEGMGQKVLRYDGTTGSNSQGQHR